MSLMVQAVKNVSATWLSLLIHAIVGLFLSPFILHRLGDNAFSVWVLVFSLTGYYGLLDLGIRSSIIRYVAKFAATKDEEQLKRFLSTSLGFYVIVAFVVLAVTGFGFFHLQSLFKISPEITGAAQALFLIAGVSVALSFPLSVFAGVLEGLQRFSWVQLTQIGVTLLRGLLIVIALTHGGRLLATGAITVGMNVVSYLVFMYMALRVLPLRLSIRAVEGHAFRKMLKYGAFAFVILLAEKLRFHSDTTLIGAFVSAAAITSYSIAARLVEYSTYAVRSMAQIFTPMSSQLHAAGDFVGLQRTFVAGNRACALIIFPLCVTLIVLGKTIIAVWVGRQYESSYLVLVLLIVPKSIYLAQSTSTRILLGMGRHRVLASVLLLEGGVNIVLSIFLLRRFGVVGVALGTAIPLACTSLFFLPRHLCRHLDMPLGRFLSRAYLFPLALCVPLAGALLFVRHALPAHNYGGLMLQMACGGFVYCGGLAWAFLIRVPQCRSWEALEQVLAPK